MQCFRPIRRSELERITAEELRQYVTGRTGDEQSGALLDVEQCIRKCRHWIHEQDNNLAVPPDLDTSVSIPASSSSHPSRPPHCSDSLDHLAEPTGASSTSLSRNISAGATKGASNTVKNSKSGSGGISKGSEQLISVQKQLTAQLLVTPPPAQSAGRSSSAGAAASRSAGASVVTTGRISSTGRATGRGSSTAATAASSGQSVGFAGGEGGKGGVGVVGNHGHDNGTGTGALFPSHRRSKDAPSPSGLAAVQEAASLHGYEADELRRTFYVSGGDAHSYDETPPQQATEQVHEETEHSHAHVSAHARTQQKVRNSSSSGAVGGGSSSVLNPPTVPHLPPLHPSHHNQYLQQQRPRSDAPLSHRAPLQGGACPSTSSGQVSSQAQARLRRASLGSKPRSTGKSMSLSPPRQVILDATEGTLTSDTDHAATRNFEDSDESEESVIDVPNMGRWGNRHDLRLEEWPKSTPRLKPNSRNTAETLTSTPRIDHDSVLNTTSPSLPPSTARTNPFSNVQPSNFELPSIHVGSASVPGCPMHAEHSARGTESSGDAYMRAGPSTAPDGTFQKLLHDMHGAEGEGEDERAGRFLHTTGGAPMHRVNGGGHRRRTVSSGAKFSCPTNAEVKGRDAQVATQDASHREEKQQQQHACNEDNSVATPQRTRHHSASAGTTRHMKTTAAKVDQATQVIAKRKGGDRHRNSLGGATRSRSKPERVNCSTQVVSVKRHTDASHASRSACTRSHTPSKVALDAVAAYHRKSRSAAATSRVATGDPRGGAHACTEDSGSQACFDTDAAFGTVGEDEEWDTTHGSHARGSHASDQRRSTHASHASEDEGSDALSDTDASSRAPLKDQHAVTGSRKAQGSTHNTPGSARAREKVRSGEHYVNHAAAQNAQSEGRRVSENSSKKENKLAGDNACARSDRSHSGNAERRRGEKEGRSRAHESSQSQSKEEKLHVTPGGVLVVGLTSTPHHKGGKSKSRESEKRGNSRSKHENKQPKIEATLSHLAMHASADSGANSALNSQYSREDEEAWRKPPSTSSRPKLKANSQVSGCSNPNTPRDSELMTHASHTSAASTQRVHDAFPSSPTRSVATSEFVSPREQSASASTTPACTPRPSTKHHASTLCEATTAAATTSSSPRRLTAAEALSRAAEAIPQQHDSNKSLPTAQRLGGGDSPSQTTTTTPVVAPAQSANTAAINNLSGYPLVSTTRSLSPGEADMAMHSVVDTTTEEFTTPRTPSCPASVSLPLAISMHAQSSPVFPRPIMPTQSPTPASDAAPTPTQNPPTNPTIHRFDALSQGTTTNRTNGTSSPDKPPPGGVLGPTPSRSEQGGSTTHMRPVGVPVATDRQTADAAPPRALTPRMASPQAMCSSPTGSSAGASGSMHEPPGGPVASLAHSPSDLTVALQQEHSNAASHLTGELTTNEDSEISSSVQSALPTVRHVFHHPGTVAEVAVEPLREVEKIDTHAQIAREMMLTQHAGATEVDSGFVDGRNLPKIRIAAAPRASVEAEQASRESTRKSEQLAKQHAIAGAITAITAAAVAASAAQQRRDLAERSCENQPAAAPAAAAAAAPPATAARATAAAAAVAVPYTAQYGVVVRAPEAVQPHTTDPALSPRADPAPTTTTIAQRVPPLRLPTASTSSSRTNKQQTAALVKELAAPTKIPSARRTHSTHANNDSTSTPTNVATVSDSYVHTSASAAVAAAVEAEMIPLGNSTSATATGATIPRSAAAQASSLKRRASGRVAATVKAFETFFSSGSGGSSLLDPAMEEEFYAAGLGNQCGHNHLPAVDTIQQRRISTESPLRACTNSNANGEEAPMPPGVLLGHTCSKNNDKQHAMHRDLSGAKGTMPLRAAAVAAATVAEQGAGGSSNSNTGGNSNVIKNASRTRLQEAHAVATGATHACSVTPRDSQTERFNSAASSGNKTPRNRQRGRGADDKGGTPSFHIQATTTRSAQRVRSARSPVVTPRGSDGGVSPASTKSKRSVPHTTRGEHEAQRSGPLSRRRQTPSEASRMEGSGRVGGSSSSGLRGTQIQRKSWVGTFSPSAIQEHYVSDSAAAESDERNVSAAHARPRKSESGVSSSMKIRSEDKERQGERRRSMHESRNGNKFVPPSALVATTTQSNTMPQPCLKCGAQALSGVHGVAACVCSPPASPSHRHPKRGMQSAHSASSTPQHAHRISSKGAFLQHRTSPSAAVATGASSRFFYEEVENTFPENHDKSRSKPGPHTFHLTPRRSRTEAHASTADVPEEPLQRTLTVDDRDTDEQGQGIQEWMLWTLGMENGDNTAFGPMPNGFDKKRKVAAWLDHNA